MTRAVNDKPKSRLVGCWRRCGNDLRVLCRAEVTEMQVWLEQDGSTLGICLFWLVVGSSVYGASIGLWRSPLQSIYVAIKFPVLILLITVSNGVLNGLLAQLFGARLSIRQSVLAMAMSFALASLILGSLAPLELFVIYHLPAMGSASAYMGHAAVMVINVGLIAAAGTLANVRLFHLLRHLAPEPGRARRILWSWLGTNMFLGCQISWNLRPFLGSPELEVKFLRHHPFRGNFYETLFQHLMTLIGA